MAEKKRLGRPPTGDPAKVMVASKLEPALHRRLVNAAYHCDQTMTDIIVAGLEAELARLEGKYNKGKEFGDPPPPKT